MNTSHVKNSKGSRDSLMGAWGRRLYLLCLFALIFTGFGQMPIFKRYYLADIPGLAWTADFYVTLFIHYVAGVLLVLLSVYYLVGYLRRGLPNGPLLSRYVVRASLLFITVGSGFLLAIRNMSGVALSPGLSYVTVWTHLIGTFLFLVAAATYLRIKRAPALSANRRNG